MTVSVEPSNVRLFSATAAFAVPSDVRTRLSPAEDIVENPVPDEPDDPDVPLVPELPVDPDVPDEPD